MESLIVLETLIVWILFGIVSSVAAKNKGHDGCGWFLAGILLGPFGFILALIVRKNQSVIDNEAIRSGSMKKCPYCAELIKQKAVVCRFCGRDVPVSEAVISNGKSPNMPLHAPEGKLESAAEPTDTRPLTSRSIILIIAILTFIIVQVALLVYADRSFFAWY